LIYGQYALPMASVSVTPHLVKYIVSKAFMNYAKDASTFPEVKRILKWLHMSGHGGVEGMGAKERIIGTLFGPGAAFWARRQWAVLRGAIPGSS
jgi:hypothetical protein